MQFLRNMLATIAGLFVFLILIIIFFTAIIAGLGKKTATEVKSKSVLVLDFKGPINERAADNIFENLRGEETKLGLKDILENIAKAKEDDNIKGILLDLGTVNAGMATMEEIRNALKEFKASGKFIYAKADFYYNGNYYLAITADKIFLTPSGEMLFNGTAASPVFFKGLLDKLGIEMQVIRHGKFKGAVEPFIKDKLSDENRLQIRKYKQAVYDLFIQNIAADRGVDASEVSAIADQMKVRSPEDAKNLKLVDALAYKDEVDAEIRSKLQIGEKEKINYITYSKYKNAPAKKSSGDHSNKIAVVYAEGEIIEGEGNNERIGGKGMAETIRKAADDDKIKAIVFRINSPGGSALASDVIWREVKLAAGKKPVVVSMGDVAASGGYYIAAPASYIIAEHNTITGSIGVFGVFPNMQKLMNEKLGLTVDTVKFGKFSDLGNVMRPFTTEEKEIFQGFIERVYDNFITRVAEGRHKNKADIDSIAQGRVWAAPDALQLGLIDKIGSLNDAIKIAAEKANISSYKITELPALKDPIEELMKNLSGESQMQQTLKKELGDDYETYSRLKAIREKQGIRMELEWW
jgi:protease-4